MANPIPPPAGSWLMAEELFDNGDPAFVDELCRIHDADRLGSFAATWYRDRRPASRKLLSLYLSRPPGVYRHEALVKRLFKIAEGAGDDEVMGWFMVALDRSIRRVKATRSRYIWDASTHFSEEFIKTPSDTTMPRQDYRHQPRNRLIGQVADANPYAQETNKRLFSIATRCYMRRRVWRYFRSLGKQDPQRYLKSICATVVRYTDDDCVDGLALLDNWSLTHVLFHHSAAIEARPTGWRLANKKGLSDLKPAPAFEEVWKGKDEPLLEMISEAKSRTVRQWMIYWAKEHHPDALRCVPVSTLLVWVTSEDPELAELAIETLTTSADLSRVTTTQWLELIAASNQDMLDSLCSLIAEQCDPDKLTLDEKVKLACTRPVPVAKLAMKWLQSSEIQSASDCRELLRIVDAECAAVRRDLMALVISKLRDSAHSEYGSVMSLLDSRYSEIRELGWDWFETDESMRCDVKLWQQLLETPYDDIRLRMNALLNRHVPNDQTVRSIAKLPTKLDANLMRLMWASVLLNIDRGGRQKPRIVTTMIERLQYHPDEADQLLPILAVALRSVRQVEFRSGLSGIVQAVERRPEITTLVQQHFPELVLN